MNKTILVIEDESRLSDSICKYLTAHEFKHLQAIDGESGLKLFELHQPDLIVLDIMLPDMNGLEVCEKIRSRSDIPIVFLTARIDDKDRLIGFEKGADDYICKPFNPLELISRIKAILRRTQENTHKETIIRGSVVLYPEEHRVTMDGSEIALTQIEFNILANLMQQPTRVFTRQELLETSHGKYSEHYVRTVDTHIKNLRKKINVNDQNEFVKTVYGVGYKFS